MRTTLASREDSVIDTFLEILTILEIFAEEDQPSTRTTKSLVCGGGNNITILKRIVKLLSSDQSTRVRNIRHEPCALPLCRLL